MAIGYRIDHDTGLLYVRAWGRLDLDGLRALGSALREDPRLSDVTGGLADLAAIEDLEIGPEVLRRYSSPLSPAVRRAVVVPSPASYGMARMYELSGSIEDGTLLLAETIEEALEWTGIPGSVLDAPLEQVFGDESPPARTAG